MSLLNPHDVPSRSMARWFGVSLAGVLFVFALLVRQRSPGVSTALVIAGVLIGLVYYAVPASRLRIIRVWQWVTCPVSWIMSHLLLGFIFFAIVLPIGLIMRLVGYDPLGIRKSSEVNPSNTNWVIRRSPENKSSYFKQF